jgi:hypothetical protein
MTKMRLQIGPLHLPISTPVREVVDRFIAGAEAKGYAVVETEADGVLNVVAVKTEQLEQTPELAGVGEEA